MRNVLVLACGLSLLQLFACGSGDNNSPGTSAGSGGTADSTSSSAQGGSGNDTTATEGGTESETSSSSATGGKTSSSTSAGGKTSSSTSSSGGTTSSSDTNSNPDSSLTPNSPYAGKLAINELCPSNKTGAMEGSSYPDWVELYNSSSEDINLKGFFITDDNADLAKFAVTKDTLVVKAGGVLILWADGDADETDFHLSFSLSAGGETLSVLDPDQKVIDSVTWANAASDKTYSRLPDGSGSFSWCATGTPNLKNGSACK